MKKLYILLFCIPSVLWAQQVSTKTIIVKPYMYTQNYEHFKRMVLISPDSEAEYIDGFDFEWGYDYTLEVTEREVGPLSDGTRYDYSLLKVIFKEKVADTAVFKMYVDPFRYYHNPRDDDAANYTLQQLNDSTHLYMEMLEIEVPVELEGRFSRSIDHGVGFRGSFKYVHGHRIRLIRFL